MNHNKKNVIQWIYSHKTIILFFLTFTCYFSTTCFLLMKSSIWLDEAVEYYMALPTKRIPNAVMEAGRWTTDWSNYYQRCLDTFQPPLYTFFMAVWLTLHDSELWFRFSGVFLGFIGTLGLWCTIKRVKGAGWASITVIIYTFFRAVTRYNQECAEYALMMAMLCWMLYFYFVSMENPSYKHYFSFITFGVLSIYSQYGASFPVFCFSCTLLIQQLCHKNIKAFFQGIISFATAFFSTIVPLYFFFLRTQLALNAKITEQGVSLLFEKNSFLKVFTNIQEVFSWIVFQNHSSNKIKYGSIIFLILLLGIVIFLLTKKLYTYHWYSFGILSTWVVYNIVAIMGFYARGQLRSRYSLFLAPLIAIFIILTIAEFSEQLMFALSKIHFKMLRNKISYKSLTIGLVIIITFPFLGIVISENVDCLFNGYDYDIHGNDKTLVSIFYELHGYKDRLYIEKNSTFSIYYYLQHNNKYSEFDELDIRQLYITELEKTIKNERPDRFYFAFTHGAFSNKDKIEYATQSIQEIGYKSTKCYEAYNAELIYFEHCGDN